MQRELNLQEELKQANAQLEAHVVEMELLLEVSKAVSGTIDLPSSWRSWGSSCCALRITEFSLLLVDETTHQSGGGGHRRQHRAVGAGAAAVAREGIAGEVARTGKRIYVPDISQEARYLHATPPRKTSARSSRCRCSRRGACWAS